MLVTPKVRIRIDRTHDDGESSELLGQALDCLDDLLDDWGDELTDLLGIPSRLSFGRLADSLDLGDGRVDSLRDLGEGIGDVGGVKG